MFTKEQRKIYHTAYWKRFKSTMNKHANAEGKRINWLNYPTKVKEIFVRLHVDTESVRFSIDIQSKDDGIRAIVWEQFHELKKVLEAEMGNDGVWVESTLNTAQQEISSIQWERSGVSIYQPNDEPDIFEFLEEKLLGFDRFYSTYNEILFALLK